MLRPARPAALWRDLCAFWRGRPRHQYAAGTLAVLIPIAIVFGFWLDSRTNVRPPPRVIYIESWPADRSDAEIRAKQQRDLVRRRAYEEERRRQFKEIDDRLRRVGI